MLWPLPTQGNFSQLMEPMTSFVFVRNPFARIVSVYVEKILLNDNQGWKDLSLSIIAMYRKSAAILNNAFEGHFNVSIQATPT